jgi:hypothetical protein
MSRYGNYTFSDDTSWMGWDDAPKHKVEKTSKGHEGLTTAPTVDLSSSPNSSSSSSDSRVFSIEINMNTLLLCLLFLVIILVALQIVTYQHVTAILNLTKGSLKV